MAKPTDDGLVIYAAVFDLLKKTSVGRRPVRLLGVSVSQINLPGTEAQLRLFQEDSEKQKRKRLNTALDTLHERHGYKSVCPGALIARTDIIDKKDRRLTSKNMEDL